MWEVRKWDGDEWPEKRFSIGGTEDGQCICISPRYGDDEKVAKDFALIVMALEMLAILEEMTEWAGWIAAMHLRAVTIIKRAKGEI